MKEQERTILISCYEIAYKGPMTKPIIRFRPLKIERRLLQ